MHTDHGLFIVFTPGMALLEENARGEPSLMSTFADELGGLFIMLKDGTRSKVHLEQDDLVFMMGEGFTEYVNPEIEDESKWIQATPHALVMPKLLPETEVARVWHGRMVLPPNGAIHPSHGKTFGDLRQHMLGQFQMFASEGNSVLSLELSSPYRTRILTDPSCVEGELFCWHLCMNLTAYNVSEEICQKQGSMLHCINAEDEVHESSHTENFYPGCKETSAGVKPGTWMFNPFWYILPVIALL